MSIDLARSGEGARVFAGRLLGAEVLGVDERTQVASLRLTFGGAAARTTLWPDSVRRRKTCLPKLDVERRNDDA
jgi:hypothetical protein